MNAIVKSEPKLMLLDYMADKYSLRPEEFGKTVRATCGLATATPEQVAAFLIVAKEYNLNPLTKEIYAFPGKGGGVVPIVSIDGWVHLVNSHPQCDGFDLVAELDPTSQLISYTCTMHRKDRAHPVVVTEYLSECIRSTEPWKMKHRMLRHKSLIQAARYAFGFAGIYDEDEGRTIADSDIVRDVGPPKNVTMIEHHSEPSPKDATSDQVEVENEALSQPDKAEAVPHKIVARDAAQWVTAYNEAIGACGDTAMVYKWIDANATQLKKLAELSPADSAKVKTATESHIAFLRKTEPKPAEEPQEQPALDMGDFPAEKPKATRGRPKGSTKAAPDFTKDYDGWLTWNLRQIDEAETLERIEALFEAIDARWSDLMPPDKETLLGARKQAESEFEP